MTRRFQVSFASTVAAMALLAGVSFADTAMEQALLTPEISAHAQVEQARDDVSGAVDDLTDAKAYLADLESGDFANIYVVDDMTGGLRCGEPAANPGCAPLTAKDKADSIAEARALVATSQAQLSDAKVELAKLEGVKSAEVEHISTRQ